FTFPHIRACDIRSALSELPELRELAADAGRYGPLWELAEGLDALPRGIAMHPCGVILSNTSLLDRLPVQPTPDGESPSSRVTMRIHFHPAERTEELYRQLLTVVDGITSRVEPLPADWSACSPVPPTAPFGSKPNQALSPRAPRRRGASFGIPLPCPLVADRQYQRVAAVTVSASGTPCFASCHRLRST
ncbi:hypothetical protein RM863_39195, partial [Streptomyces sp. DSM 41014]